MHSKKWFLEYQISKIAMYMQSSNNILIPVANLLKRVYSFEKVHDEIKKLTYNFFFFLVKSNNKELKNEAMTMLSNIFIQIKKQSNFISPQDMYQWMNENHILSLIFDPSNY